MNAAGSTPRLVMRGIVKRFGATDALAGVDLEVAPGEIHVLLGQNGAGKSTLMKVLSGAVAPDAGTIELDGQPFAPRDPLEGRRAGVAMIYQELSLVGHLSVAENIFLGLEPARGGFLDRRAMRRRAREALSSLGRSDIDPDDQARVLPIAARQVVEIARALASGCRVLVLDEPTSSLGKPDVERLFATIRRLAVEGQAIVYITHFLEEAMAIGDRYSVLRDGRVVTVGQTDAGAAGWSEGIVAAMVGRPGGEAYPRSPRVRGEVLLEVRDLSGSEKPIRASLTVHRGEVVGVFGLVGSGRTELARAIFGLDRIRGGTVQAMGVSGARTPAERWSMGIGMVSEDRNHEGLAVNLAVADNLMLSKLGPGPLSWVTRRRQRRAVVPWIDRLGIRVADLFGPANRLSGGNQQKVAVARLLYHDVDVLILDEPTRGIDVGSKAAIFQVVDDLVSRSVPAKGVLLISSYLPELLGLCDRIAVMRRGQLSPPVDVALTDEHSLLLAASGGEAA